MEHFLGALKPKADIRDYRIAATTTEYPESYLCENLPPVKNQRNVSSCVAHATAAILEVFNKTETGKFVPLSTNFIYGMQGIAFGKLTSGMYLRDACKIVKEYGNATEASIGGNTEQPKCTEWLKGKLTDNIYEEAKNYISALRSRLLEYQSQLSDINIEDAKNIYTQEINIFQEMLLNN